MFYKVPFTAVPDLVARRQVLLRGGYAYVREAQVRHHQTHLTSPPSPSPPHTNLATAVGTAQACAWAAGMYAVVL